MKWHFIFQIGPSAERQHEVFKDSMIIDNNTGYGAEIDQHFNYESDVWYFKLLALFLWKNIENFISVHLQKQIFKNNKKYHLKALVKESSLGL